MGTSDSQRVSQLIEARRKERLLNRHVSSAAAPGLRGMKPYVPGSGDVVATVDEIRQRLGRSESGGTLMKLEDYGEEEDARTGSASPQRAKSVATATAKAILSNS